MPKAGRIMRFLCAGGLGVSLYYLILYTLTDLLGVWYVFSAIIGSLINWTSNFLLQKHWTFQNKDTKNIRRQATSYVVMVTALFVANLALLYAFVEFMHLWYLVAQVITTAILTVVSYVATSRIFSHPTAS